MDPYSQLIAHHAQMHTDAVGGGDPSYQDNLLRGATDEQMRQRPLQGFPSLAWLLWHMTRVEDVAVNLVVANLPEVLKEGEWATKMNILRYDVGGSLTDAEVDEFDQQVDIDALLAYRAVVGRQTHEILLNLAPETLNEVIDDSLMHGDLDARLFCSDAVWKMTNKYGPWRHKGSFLFQTAVVHSSMHYGAGEAVRQLVGLPPT